MPDQVRHDRLEGCTVRINPPAARPMGGLPKFGRYIFEPATIGRSEDRPALQKSSVLCHSRESGNPSALLREIRTLVVLTIVSGLQEKRDLTYKIAYVGELPAAFLR